MKERKVTMLEAKPITEDRFREIELVLSESNKIINETYKEHKKEFSDRRELRDHILNENWLAPNKVEAIQAAYDVENELLCGVIGCIAQCAARSAKKNNRIHLYEDFYHEGILFFYTIVLQYTEVQYEFKSYMLCSMNRQLAKVNQKDEVIPSSFWAVEETKNLFKAKTKLENELGHKVSFEDIFQKLELSPGKVKAIENVVNSKIIDVVEKRSHNVGHKDEMNDITAYGKQTGYFCFTGTKNGSPVYKNQGTSEYSKTTIVKAFELAELSSLERLVIEGYAVNGELNIDGTNAKNGWMACVAAENINPETGKPFSRMAISYAYDRGLVKIRLKYLELIMPSYIEKKQEIA